MPAPTFSKPPSAPASMKPAPALKPPSIPSKPSPAQGRTRKTFAIEEWTDTGEGQKILLYSHFGMGKSTLASMAPNPIFIGVDDGGRKIRNPKTGTAIRHIGTKDQPIVTFEDIRDAIRQENLWTPGTTLVLDTITKADELAEQTTLDVYKDDKGNRVSSLEEYGWGKGDRYHTETMRLLLADFDPLVRRGVNILLLAQQGQATVSNLEGTDYSEDGPLLNARPKTGANVRSEICAWVDYIFRIGHADIAVLKAHQKATKGKVTGDVSRVVYTTKQLHYVAKARPLSNGTALPEAVTFADPTDDSIWQYLFGEVK